ncbi:URC4/urg3 family protein [Flexibacterium corallicola]|uniref:URC4/urg3 family protein n=1 Tax=Flexibacterium corallicola TaxID=3037259 RepID=UPI00286F8187|nr:URC4/urg3 family protein [Pseudovibrio sp. M1P-2-3]
MTIDIPQSDALSLLSAKSVRERANELLELGLQGELEHFSIDLSKLRECAHRTLAVTKNNYPDLQVPLHSRWRHFEIDGVDRWAMLAGARRFSDERGMGRAAYDLAILSVLLDAGAGAQWKYHEPVTGDTLTRSEGLAIGSLGMFAAGMFSEKVLDPLRADAIALFQIDPEEIAEGFQVSAENPLVGLDGRAALLRRLGEAVSLRPDLFSKEDEPRPGGLFDVLYDEGLAGKVTAGRVLEVVLDGLGPIWPGREEIDGVNLGDVWRHSKVSGNERTKGLMPLHKLSQWIAYSLIEPLAWAGVEVTELDDLTGLAEYRNGGLFVDCGILKLRDPDNLSKRHEVGSELIVEWRALTVALLDKLAERIRIDLDVTKEQMPLACVLEGGSWAAGRQIAQEKRPGGTPPIEIVSDGTVF